MFQSNRILTTLNVRGVRKKANELYTSSSRAQSREKFEEKDPSSSSQAGCCRNWLLKNSSANGFPIGCKCCAKFQVKISAADSRSRRTGKSLHIRKFEKTCSGFVVAWKGASHHHLHCCASVKEKQTEKEAIIVSAPRTAKRENNKRRRNLWLEIRWRKDDRKEIFILEILLLLTARHNNMAQNINPERAASSNPSKQSDETLINNNNHAVSKRWVALLWRLSALFSN